MRPLPRTLSAELSNDELSSLINIIREKSFKGKHLEIGTAAGGTLCCMMKAFEDGEHPHYVTEKYVDTLLVLCKTKESESPEISLIDRAWASTLAPLLRLEVFTKKLLKKRNGKFPKNKFHTPL